MTVPLNCALSSAATNQGGNLEGNGTSTTTTCGIAASAQDPLLATSLDASDPPALAIPANSPAVDLAPCSGRTGDQRGAPRPIGAQCDAGAYEYTPPPDTTIAGAGPYTFAATEAGSTFECSIDGGAFSACGSPYTPSAAPGAHTLSVRAIGPFGGPDATPAQVSFSVAATPTPTPTVTASPTPTPTPVVNKIVVVKVTDGKVKIKRKGAKSFVPLTGDSAVPVGSEVDTKDGEIELTSIPKAGKPSQTAKFFDGIFKISQSSGITTLTLTEALAACPKNGHAAAAAKKPKTRKLWGSGKGAFRTSGKYSAATVRGTKWLVTDSCSGTRTTVSSGVVSVRDNVRHKTIIVRAHHTYLARPKR